MTITIREIRDHMLGVAHWIDPDSTCDQVLFGDQDRQVQRIGTGWVPCPDNLQAAAADRCDLFICHEALTWNNWAPNVESRTARWDQNRLEILKNSNMACMRLHDTWDNFPEYGIRDSWRFFLGLTELIEERPYFRPGYNVWAPGKSLALCRVKTQTLGDFASFVAAQCSEFACFGGVTLCGDKDAQIATVATGVGCHVPAFEMLELGADVLVLTFDRAWQTDIRIPLSELGANLLVVEHGVSEMPGMRNMASYLEKTFPEITTSFYCHEPAAEIIC